MRGIWFSSWLSFLLSLSVLLSVLPIHASIAMPLKSQEVLGDIFYCLLTQGKKEDGFAIYSKYGTLAPVKYRHATLLEDGYLLPRDIPTAMTLYQQSADDGYAAAAYSFAKLYQRNQVGVADRIDVYLRYLKKSARKGDVDAMFSLAWHYEKGDILEQNTSSAKRWYRKAAGKGDSASMVKLAKLLFTLGDTKKALSWAILAHGGGSSGGGFAGADALLTDWKKKLPPATWKSAMRTAKSQKRRIKQRHLFLPMHCETIYEDANYEEPEG